MSDRESWNWGDPKLNALIGAGCACLVIGWMMFARPDEEAASSRGFNLGGAGSVPRSGRPFASRSPQTGLDMVSATIGDGPAGVTPNSMLLPGGAPADAPPETLASAREAPAAPPADTAPPAPSPADEARDLAAAGVSTDPRELNTLGAKPGLLSALAAKMLNHPKVLAAVFNNKKVVDAFMSRSLVKKNCESGSALKSYLSDSKSDGMTKVFPVIEKALSSPGTASGLVSALAGTEMVKRLTACPSAKELSNDPTAVVTIAMANPKALGLLMDPRGAMALAANPQAAGVLAGLQSKLGGAR